MTSGAGLGGSLSNPEVSKRTGTRAPAERRKKERQRATEGNPQIGFVPEPYLASETIATRLSSLFGGRRGSSCTRRSRQAGPLYRHATIKVITTHRIGEESADPRLGLHLQGKREKNRETHRGRRRDGEPSRSDERQEVEQVLGRDLCRAELVQDLVDGPSRSASIVEQFVLFEQYARTYAVSAL